jgi:hypothetical protein
MEAVKGKRVQIRFDCRLKNGIESLVGGGATLEFMIGAGSIPPVLESGILGMKPGERRTVMLPAAEANRFPFPEGTRFAVEGKTPPGIAYEFGPGDAGDVSESIPRGEAPGLHEYLPAGADIYFEIEMLAVDDDPLAR